MAGKTKIHGTIVNASWKQEGTKYPYISGWIKGDTKGRFRDGDFIYTSVVKKHEVVQSTDCTNSAGEPCTWDLIYTLNSVYRIESWLKDTLKDKGLTMVGEIF